LTERLFYDYHWNGGTCQQGICGQRLERCRMQRTAGGGPLEPLSLFPSTIEEAAVERAAAFPRLRYMGSKYRIVPALVNTFSALPFDTALDAFSGSGVVGYTLKALGKQVTANDFLHFPHTVARAVIENPGVRLDPQDRSEMPGYALVGGSSSRR
jgi:hypothetical protein